METAITKEQATKISPEDADDSEIIAIEFNDIVPGVKSISCISRGGQAMNGGSQPLNKRFDFNC